MKIKTNPKHLQKIVELVLAPEFQSKLAEAGKFPEGKKARKLYSLFAPHIVQIGQNLPFSPASQKSSLSRMIAMIRHFGKFISINCRTPNFLHYSCPQ
jgi:hypothetical protein